jgi:hypothetical protein
VIDPMPVQTPPLPAQGAVESVRQTSKLLHCADNLQDPLTNGYALLNARQQRLPEAHWLESSQSSSVWLVMPQVVGPVPQASVPPGSRQQGALLQTMGSPPGVRPQALSVTGAGVQVGSTTVGGAWQVPAVQTYGE